MCQRCARFFRRICVWLVKPDKSWDGDGVGIWCASFSGATAKPENGAITAVLSTAPVRHAQTHLNKVLREHDLGRRLDFADITLNEYLDRWLETAAKPRLREKS